MGIGLRGHHLLCLLGFRGMGYSAEFAANMTKVYNELRERPETPITIIAGPDDLCACFPADAEPHCHNASVASQDARVLEKLGYEVGLTMPWSAVIERVRHQVEPEAINEMCVTCQWRTYGVCEAGVRTITQGGWLPALPGQS
ncbi:DUF1284 domain-containing protein [Paenibacillus sp. R14(2021)]|uniref:DUF1284 domain-containing protein n=1 Tax=Paenibacillus sp. R14(2021) TaxID=2859228 RepID=UPI001C612B0A|nr:DUF1284 domain-containing protein [Paenibacillus sp. R14(2021)]